LRRIFFAAQLLWFRFFVLIRVLRKICSPDIFIQLNAFSANMLFGGFFYRLSPHDSKHPALAAILDFNNVSDLYITPKSAKPYSSFAGVECMRCPTPAAQK
jgi:hypothetical protein